MIKLYVIIPDKASGDYFCKILNENGIATEYDYHKIHPRVLDNVITNRKDVPNDLNNIFRTFKDKTRSVVIACNTLQLWLPEIAEENKKNVKIYTTFEACEWKFRNMNIKPLWIGTTPLVRVTTKFPTFLTYENEEVQEQVQELIWRLKMLFGDDIQTSSDKVKKDFGNVPLQKLKIKIIKKEILDALKKLKIKKVIAGCTELPMIFKQFEEGIEFIDPAKVLAEYVKSQSVSLLFAGGTISAIASKDGIRVGGQVFDFLEKLNQKTPGAYKNVNVTKEEIVYNGLSENMTKKEHLRLYRAILTILRTGVSRIVITHGTDSMEQTARYIYKKLNKKLVKSNTKIVFTGSNEHIDSPTTDAWENLIFAINGKIKEKSCMVYVAFHNKFINSFEVVKDMYVDGKMTYLSKSSKEYQKGLIDFNYKKSNLIQKLEEKLGGVYEKESVYLYEVNKIKSNHNRFLRFIKNSKIKAVILVLYHSGTANTLNKESSVLNLVLKLIKKGIVFFGATENGEPTDLRLYESSISLLNAGVVPSYNMTFPVVEAKLKLLNINKNKLSPRQIITKMLTNYAGEIDEKIIDQIDIDPILQK